MPGRMGERERLEQLINENELLEAQMQQWQERGDVPTEEIRKVQREYLEWYASAKALVPPDELDRFKDMYEGGDFIKRLKAFLNAPLEQNQFYDPSAEAALFPKWQHPFDGTCRNSMATQREILIHALHRTADVVQVLEELSAYFRRLPEFLDTLRRSENPNVPAPSIANENDLQVLLHAHLKMLYDDVRPEDYVSQFGGASSRVDFLIREAGVLVETKMTRRGLTDRRVGEELLVDWGRYQRHPDYRGIFALVYDPNRHLSNAAALESDLSRDIGGVWARVIVVR